MSEYDILLSRFEDLVNKAQNQNRVVFMDFLDPNMLLVLEREITRYSFLDIDSFGGNIYCERKMLAIFPLGFEVKEEDYPIKVIKIEKNPGFLHKDVMGSLFNLGLDRAKIGDIQVREENAQIFVHNNLAEFISLELTQISRYKVEVEIEEAKNAYPITPKFVELYLIVPSMRLDAVIGNIFKLSRNEATLFVKGNKVRVNHNEVTKPAFSVKEGDIISVRTKGRAIIEGLNGSTKKGNLKLKVNKFV